MNIFFLAECPYKSAEMMVDKHVVKMIVETAQLLSTAHRLLDGHGEKYIINDSRETLLYKVTHRNHPSSIWARTSLENYNWLADHLDGLLREYTYRYNRIHKTSALMYSLGSPPLNLKEWDWTTPPSCMPEEYHIGGYIDNYREYYRKAKSHIHKWTGREPPLWLILQGTHD